MVNLQFLYELLSGSISKGPHYAPRVTVGIICQAARLKTVQEKKGRVASGQVGGRVVSESQSR